ncbi:uncharacterized protein PAC_19298 [Phialocephala subalpina]|uniref:Uncharacterized protein n=1 Tax=Phialocephala subalpina TaxID=576137 RepID=A0A1L7XWM1_9HELO|nr:uncharacterized protein PAC_19298 [Phialocephala subalpina]
MLFNSITAASLLALCTLSNASALKYKRATESDVTLYAYGSEANGAPIFYADGNSPKLSLLSWNIADSDYKGLAYVGETSTLASASVATNVTFTVDPDDTTVPWTITAKSSTVVLNATYSMYIVPTSGSFTQVGFASSNSTLPTGAVTTGFSFFGTNVAYAASSVDYELQFWANATTTDGIYALYWNAASTDVPSGAFSVTVKTTAPTVTT